MSNNGTDTYGYKGWLVSDSFVKRAFAVFGYASVGYLLFAIVFGLFLVFCSIIAAFVFGMGSAL